MNAEFVGHWTVRGHEDHRFQYAKSWLDSELARPLSISMPLRPPSRPYRGPLVRAYFDNLLPDRDEIRQRIQNHYGAASANPFDLLAEIGRDCVGAVQLLPEGSPPPDPRRIEGIPLDSEQIADELAGLFRAPLGQRADDYFRISLAGAQEKIAFLYHEGRWKKPAGTTPTTHIFKLPVGEVHKFGPDLTTSVENEWLCHKVLQRLNVPVANCEMATFDAQRTLIVERFDRRWSKDGTWIMRLPQEDLCQATATPPGQKYESDGGPGIKQIMDTLLGSQFAYQDRVDFFRTQIVFWMLCAIDGHAKNFSLFLEPRGRYRLTPRYDVISAYPVLGHGRGLLAPQRIKMAMAVSGKNRHYHWNEIGFRHWVETATQCGLGTRVRGLVHELVERAPKVAREVGEALPDDFPESVAEPILQGVAASADTLRHQLPAAP